MSRQNVGHLSLDPHHLRPSVALRGPDCPYPFDSADDKLNEDLVYRAGGLRGDIALRSSLIDPIEALRLASQLEQAVERGSPYPSLASSYHIRDFRDRLGTQLHKLTLLDDDEPSTFTAIPTGHCIDAIHLEQVDPRRLGKQFRTDLNRAGGITANGYLFAALHGEFDPESMRYLLHWHGVASGGMTDVLDALRDTPKYRSDAHRSGAPPDHVYKRLRISRKPLTNLPAPLTYIYKSFWPSKRIGLVGSRDVIKRNRTIARICEPYHSQHLLWLDRFTLSDMTLLYNLSVAGGEFRKN